MMAGSCPRPSSGNAARRRSPTIRPGRSRSGSWTTPAFETTTGGTWRIAGCRDYWSKYEHPWHVSSTANQFDAIDAVELALADYEAMFGHPLADECETDTETGEILPVVTIVSDNGWPIPVLPVRGVHPQASRTGARPHPSEDAGTERVT